MSTNGKHAVAMRGAKLSQEACALFLHTTGLWNQVTEADRRAFILRSEILDSVGGKKIAEAMAKIKEEK